MYVLLSALVAYCITTHTQLGTVSAHQQHKPFLLLSLPTLFSCVLCKDNKSVRFSDVPSTGNLTKVTSFAYSLVTLTVQANIKKVDQFCVSSAVHCCKHSAMRTTFFLVHSLSLLLLGCCCRERALLQH